MLGFHPDRRGEALAGKHRIVSQLGQGGSADVYLAVADGPSGFHKLVVLKVLKQCLRDDRELREMFLREARLAARLQHPNIVQTNQVLEVDGTPILVMEYLEGQPLTQVIVRGRQAPHRFTLPMQLRVLIDALNGLHAAHELADFDGTPLGVVHRDVSPHNLFVTVEGQGKVLDFGIAKLDRRVDQVELGTDVGTIKGRLRYMAPEQLAGGRLDRRADIYAAGVILWEALAGERMWRDCSEEQIRSRVQAGDLPAAAAAGPPVPDALARICGKALALSVEDRYATALELADDLEGALPRLDGVVSRRDIGCAVARMFEDVRAQTRAAIERVVSSSGGGDGDSSGAGDTGDAAPAAETRATAPAPAARPPRRRRLVLAVAGGTAAALLMASALGVWKAGDAFGGRSASTVTPPINHRAKAPQPVALDEPAAAPASAALPRRSWRERGALVTRSPARRSPVVSSTPATTTPELSVVVESAAGAALPADGAREPARHVEPNAGARDCDQPFFVDAQGIKRFRSECM